MFLIERLQQHMGWADMVLVMDFGHGVLEPLVRDYVQENAGFMALNCQTNSNNHGFNLINRQYHRADSFSLDQAEISLATGKKIMDFAEELEGLRGHFGAKYAWLTRGGDETIGIGKGELPISCPSLEFDIVDTIGAGDAFCSLASLAAAKGIPLKTSTLWANLRGHKLSGCGNSEASGKPLPKGSEAMLSM